MSRTVLFPVGPEPGWETKDKNFNPEGLPCHSVVDSLVLLQSLRQSRNKWLNAFPMLPPTKGRAPKQVDPSRSRDYYLENYGHFQMCVGPHIFSHTQLFEVRYKVDQPASTLSLHPSTSAGLPVQPEQTAPFSAENPSMSHHLAQAVNDVASQDPVFKGLLDKAINGLANPEEYDNFVAHLSTINASMPPPPPPPWDIAVQFDELPGTQKHVLPKGTIKLEKSHPMPGGTCHDVLITIPMPLPKEPEGVPAPASNPSATCVVLPNATNASHMVTFQWKGVTQTAYELLSRWSTDTRGVTKPAGDLGYLPHRLPDSELLAAIQSVLNAYPMRSIKPANADRVKRRPSQRKSTSEKSRSTKSNAAAVPAPAAPAPPVPSSSIPPPTSPQALQAPHSPTLPPPPPAITFAPVTFAPTPSIPAPDTPKASPSVSTYAFVDSSPSDRPIIKRRKYTRRNSVATPASTIACVSCHQTGVPLMYGGRYCRECINSGRTPVATPGATGTSTSMPPPAHPDPSMRYANSMTPTPQTPPVHPPYPPPTTPVYHHTSYAAPPESQFRHWTPGSNPP